MAGRSGLYGRRVLARNVRRLRDARGMNQEELADAAGISQSQISKIEGAKLNIQLDTLQHLAMALGARMADLVDEGKG
jgi:transcriptional regulator with XRE-family HTH domain